MKEKKQTIGITLSGGGARGIAHIGVLAALEQNDIYPDIISGASAGSIVGSLYAAGKKPFEILELAADMSLWKTFRPSFPFRGLSNLNYLAEQLSERIDEDSFEHLQKKLFIAITNLNKGRVEFINKGELFKIIVASCSIPLVFKAININGDTYVDGGLLRNLPVEPIRGLSDVVIGVNVMPHVVASSKRLDGFRAIGIRTFDLAIWNNTQTSMFMCDVIVEPKRVIKYHVFEFNKVEELYQIGYDAAMDKMDDIKKVLKDARAKALKEN